MTFERITEANIAAYLAGLPAMRERFTSFDDLDVREVGDGNLNFVFIVTNRRNADETVVVKQAVPFLRVVGESWPLTRHRMDFEVAALERFGALCPEHVPAVYHASSDMSLVVMRNLRNHRILRHELMEGLVFPRMADHLSTFMARTLFHTSDLFLGHDAKKQAVGRAINIELCKITEDFVLTHPYEDNETNAYNPALPRAAIDAIQREPGLRAAVGEIKYAFMTRAEALIHGDLHTGSIMANAEETFVIDPEFSFYGPMGFDPGALIANLLLAYLSQDYRQRAAGRDPAPYRDWLLAATREVWTSFEAKFLGLWREEDGRRGTSFIGRDLDGHSAEAFRQAFMKRLFADTLGFAGVKMMRRIVGLAKVAEIATIPDLEERARAEVAALRLGAELARGRAGFAGIGDVVDLARELSAR
jgi:5-methylthioribose kinase